MALKDADTTRFSDPTAPAGGVRGGHRALPAVLAVLVAMIASARAAEALVPMSRTMASEAAAVRMLSEAIVRAVRDLSGDDTSQDRIDPADGPKAPALDGADLLALPPVETGDQGADGARLGWHQFSRPPPIV